MTRVSKSKRKSSLQTRRFRRHILFISLSALVIKIFIITRIQGFDWYQAGNGDLGMGLGKLLDNNYLPPNAWYGADGENYLQGLRGLVSDGYYSQEGKLSYWPAGYPLLMWPLIEISRSYFFIVLAALQSILFALGSIWFIDELRKTRISKACYAMAFVLAYNPTLSLSTISIGYEAPVVALSLISTAALMNYFIEKKSGLLNFNVPVASIAFCLAAFMQPRLVVIAFVFFAIWGFAKYKLLSFLTFMALTLGMVSIAPVVLASRNQEVHGYFAVSTNLGITMRLGAGPNATGGYSNRPVGLVECPPASGNSAELDQAMVKCVIHWYLKNPTTSLKLFWNKSRYFWSPWFGPEANGTMARNPWSRFHPFKSTAETEAGYNLVYGGFGKVVSWAWMLGGVLLLVRGVQYLWRAGDLERLLAIVAGSSFILNLMSSILTIGDHRFRIPTMAMSLLLQIVGIQSFSSRGPSHFRKPSQFVPWPLFQRKNIGETKL